MREIIALSGLLVMQPCERPPVEYQGDAPPAVIFFAHPDVVETVCREAVPNADPKRRILACTNGQNRVMLMPDPCLYDDAYARLMCHEKAHLNRWRHE